MNSRNNGRADGIPTLDMLDSVQVLQKVLPLDNDKVLLLPILHVLYFRQNGFHGENGIGAACLEFGFFAWGADRESARECLEGIILSYFRGRIENNEIQEILDDVSDDFMEPYWALYRRFSIIQAASAVPAPYVAVLEELRRKEESVEGMKNKLNDAELAIESLLAENAMLKKQQEIEDKKIVHMQDFLDNKTSLPTGYEHQSL